MSDLEKETVTEQTQQQLSESNNESNQVAEETSEVDKVRKKKHSFIL